MSGYLTRPGSFAALRRVEVTGAQLGAGPIHRATQGPASVRGLSFSGGAFPVTGSVTLAYRARRIRASARVGITTLRSVNATEGDCMKRDRAEGNLKQVKCKVKEQWG